MSQAGQTIPVISVGQKARGSFLLPFALFASASNIVPLVPLSLLLLVADAGQRALRGEVPHARGPTKWFLLYLVLSIVYCGLTGVSLLNAELYRRELKFIFPFLALVLFAQMHFNQDLDKKIVTLLESFSVLTVIFFFISIVLLDQNLSWIYPYSKNMWDAYGDTFVYSGQFLDHSAFGAFLATLFLLLFGIFRWGGLDRPRKLILLLELSCLFALLYVSRSRAFMIAVVLVVLFSTFFFHVRARSIRTLAVFAIVIGAALSFRSIAINVLEFQDSDQQLSNSENTADYNVAARYVLWGIAINDFLQSPLIGIGISRFDDNYFVLSTLPGYDNLQSAPKEPIYSGSWPFRIEVDPFVAHTDQHAHNAYLHLLAEGGLTFFSLACLMYYKVIRFLRGSINTQSGAQKGLRMGITYALYGVLIGSLFGNNIFSIIPMYMIMSLVGYSISRSFAEDVAPSPTQGAEKFAMT